MALPGLIVFDLDFTLWDCGGLWVDCTSYPFRKREDGRIVDSDGKNLRLYEDVPEILDEIAKLHATRAAGQLPRGAPSWQRAQDILSFK